MYGYWIGQDGKKLPVPNEFEHTKAAFKYLGRPPTSSASEAHIEMLAQGFARVAIDGASLNVQTVEPFSDEQVTALRGISDDESDPVGNPDIYVDVGFGNEISSEDVTTLPFGGRENWARIRAKVAEVAAKKKTERAEVDPELAEKTGSAKSQQDAKTQQTGKRGGRFYLTNSGTKVYLKR